MAKYENTSSQDRSTPRRLGSKQVAKDEKRAATIAAYRGDGLQIRWQNMQENEQPRSQHTEGKGLQNRWQKMSFSGFIFVSHVFVCFFKSFSVFYQLAFMFQTCCLSLRCNVQLYELRKQLRKSTKSPGTFSQKYNKTHTHRHNSKSKLGLFLIPEHCY